MAEQVRASPPNDSGPRAHLAHPHPHPSGDRAMSAGVFDIVREALGRYPLSAADRDDLTQKSVETAFARWDSYRTSGGTLRGWLCGIVRNEVRHFMRTHRRRAHRENEHAWLASMDEAETPEDAVCTRDLFNHLIGDIPTEQRRIVILVRVAEHTIREAAAREGISHSTAHARYQAGMKAFTEAAERYRNEQKSRGVVPLPHTIDELLDTLRLRPAEGEGHRRAWARFARQHGFDEELGPPESGPRASLPGDDEPPDTDPPIAGGRVASRRWSRAPSRAPSRATGGESARSTEPRRDRWLRRLALVLLVTGSIIAGVLLDRWLLLGETQSAALAPPAGAAPTEPTMGDTPPVGAALAGVEPGVESVPVAASTAPLASAEEPKAHVEAPTPRPLTGARAGLDHRRLREELAILDRARSALEGGSKADALAALHEHERRFPRGGGAPLRERLWIDASAR